MAQVAFLRVAQCAATWSTRATGSHILDPVCTDARLYDGDSCWLSLVVTARQSLQQQMAEIEPTLRSAGMSGTVAPHVFELVRAAVETRVTGLVDSGVGVFLLQDIHYLGTVLEPKLFTSQAPNEAHMTESAFGLCAPTLCAHLTYSPPHLSSGRMNSACKCCANRSRSAWQWRGRRRKEPPKTQAESFQALQEEWRAIPEAYFKNHADSMERHCAAVVTSKGCPTEYD